MCVYIYIYIFTYVAVSYELSDMFTTYFELCADAGGLGSGCCLLNMAVAYGRSAPSYGRGGGAVDSGAQETKTP